MEIKNIYDAVIFTSAALTIKDALIEAIKTNANLYGAVKAKHMRVFTGLYAYQVWAVLAEDGTRWVRMGCLFKPLEDWEKIGIRKSNIIEFPDNGSRRSEERIRAFEFAKLYALWLE